MFRQRAECAMRAQIYHFAKRIEQKKKSRKLAFFLPLSQQRHTHTHKLSHLRTQSMDCEIRERCAQTHERWPCRETGYLPQDKNSSVSAANLNAYELIGECRASQRTKHVTTESHKHQPRPGLQLTLAAWQRQPNPISGQILSARRRSTFRWIVDTFLIECHHICQSSARTCARARSRANMAKNQREMPKRKV